MYAIIADSGRQFRVEEGQEIVVDYRESSKGDACNFENVLAVSTGDALTLGAPYVDGASVSAEVVGVQQGPKLFVQKFRRRKNSRRRTGHRQLYTRVRIGKISS